MEELEKLAIGGSIRAIGVCAGARFFTGGSSAFFAGAVRTCLRLGPLTWLFFFVMTSGSTGADELSVVSGVEAGATRVGVAIVVLEVVVAGFGAAALAFGFVGAFVVVAVLVFGAGAGWGAGSGFGLVVATVVGVTSVVGPVGGGGSSASAGATSAGSVTPSAKTAINRPACAALIRALPSTLPSALLTCAPNAMWNQMAM